MRTDLRGAPPKKAETRACSTGNGGIYQPSDCIVDAPDWRELRILAALVCSAHAREAFMGLGIGPAIFADPDVRTFAAWVLATGGTGAAPAHVGAAIMRFGPDLDFSSGILRDEAGALRDDWAAADARRYAADLVRTWLPPRLRWVADRLEAGESWDVHAKYLRLLLDIGDPAERRAA